MLLSTLVRAGVQVEPITYVASTQQKASTAGGAGSFTWTRSFSAGDLIVFSVATEDSTGATTATVDTNSPTTYTEMETTTTTVKRRLRFFSYVMPSGASSIDIATNYSSVSGEYEVITVSLLRGANTTAYDQLRTTSTGNIDLKKGGVLIAHGLGFDDTSTDGISINNDIGTQIAGLSSIGGFASITARKVVDTSTETLALSNTASTPTFHFIYALSFEPE